VACHCEVERLLALEMAVDVGARDAGHLGDLPRHHVRSVSLDGLDRRVDDRQAAFATMRVPPRVAPVANRFGHP
jgi:hypothetical protein